MYKSAIWLTLGLTLAACASDGGAPAPDTTLDRATHPPRTTTPQTPAATAPTRANILIERDGSSVIYRGRLTGDGLDALRRIGADPQITTLLIDSAGGEIVVGMDFGNWIIDRGLDVVIDRACLSSCANYVFTAGRKKEIRPGAVVAWHGSAKQAGLLEQLDQYVEQQIASRTLPPAERQRLLHRARRANVAYLTSAIHKQDAFFFRAGVDEYVTRVGNEKYGVRGFFYLSVDDMAVFGIENVTADEGYSEMEPKALAERIGFPVQLVELD